ncbi:FimB/Mfa2 family fimbrial subunit [uncultured Bacteroides sp.]|uniref:FimB/Mfa2 family fimbrial subunit n=1 Tax=uncultured Bacteroides sp. TaxID=162156 RepID=UPI0025ED2330|nr:FimB/Mfa2 family fimbrial subunit [uncultured Bacteroides sp.]
MENTSTSARIEEQALAVSRMVASMNITVRGLELLSGSGGGDYSLVVHETASRLDFEGHYSGAPASYQFSPRFEAGKDYKIPPFNLFPTLEENKGLTIDIYRNGDLLRSLNTDSSHQPIIPVVGQTLNVLLDFKLSVSVEVELTAWGEETVWKEYN